MPFYKPVCIHPRGEAKVQPYESRKIFVLRTPRIMRLLRHTSSPLPRNHCSFAGLCSVFATPMNIVHSDVIFLSILFIWSTSLSTFASTTILFFSFCFLYDGQREKALCPNSWSWWPHNAYIIYRHISDASCTAIVCTRPNISSTRNLSTCCIRFTFRLWKSGRWIWEKCGPVCLLFFIIVVVVPSNMRLFELTIVFVFDLLFLMQSEMFISFPLLTRAFCSVLGTNVSLDSDSVWCLESCILACLHSLCFVVVVIVVAAAARTGLI